MKKTKEKTMAVILAIGFTALCGCSNTHKTVATEELQCKTTESVTETSITSEYTDEEMEQMKSDVTQAFWNLQNEFGDEEQIRDFSEYLLENYDPVRIAQAADEWHTQFDQGIAYSVDENAYHELSQKLYKETGKSLYVLWNEFQGILEDETVAIEGKPVVYSLGDFWFNSETKYTTVLNLKVDMEGLKEMSLLPCRQENDTTHMLYGDEAAQFYDYMRELSPNAEIDSAGVVSPAE